MPLRARATPSVVPADAPARLFATTPDLVSLHRALVDALEAFAAGVDGGRASSFNAGDSSLRSQARRRRAARASPAQVPSTAERALFTLLQKLGRERGARYEASRRARGARSSSARTVRWRRQPAQEHCRRNW